MKHFLCGTWTELRCFTDLVLDSVRFSLCYFTSLQNKSGLPPALGRLLGISQSARDAISFSRQNVARLFVLAG